MRRMEIWTDALTGLYNSCLTSPCRGHESPPLPETPPERPPLPLFYTEYQFYNKRHGLRLNPVGQDSHHSVEWNRGTVTDRYNGMAQQVFKMVQRSNPHHQYQSDVFSKADVPNIHQMYKNSNPRMHPNGQTLNEWSSDEWTHDSDRYLRIEMSSPMTTPRTGRSVVETQDSESEYFTPRITPRALRRQVASPSQDSLAWGRYGPQPPPLNPSQGFYYHSLPAPRSKMVIPKPRRLCISPQGVKISMVEKPKSMRATITPTSPPSSSPPSQHHFYPIQHHMKTQSSNKHPLNQWLQSQGGYGGVPQTQRFVSQPVPIKPSCHVKAGVNEHSLSEHRQDHMMRSKATDPGGPKSQVDLKPKNVFGQPLVLATLRTVQSPQQTRKNKVEEDLRTLLTVNDNIERNRRKVTNIDGTLYKYPEDSVDLLHSPSRTTPQSSSPGHKHRSPQIRRNGFGSVSELGETAAWDFKAHEDQSPMASVATLSTQELDRLINVKDKMASICTSEYQEMGTVLPESNAMSRSPPEMLPGGSTIQGNDSEDLTRQLQYLEAILGDLKTDLNKERKDRLALMAEVESLRKNNYHLLEESLFAYEELHKLKTMFSIAPGDIK